MAGAGARSALAARPRHRVREVADGLAGDRVAAHPRAWPVLLLLFGSGAAALAYEVLWLKELALLLGSTARSAAITLAVFFFGLSLGSEAFGRRAAASRNPLRLYALLEVGVAVAALGYFFLFDAYLAVYSSLFQTVRGWPGALLALKVLLSIGLLLPASFLMGGTLPLVAEHLARRGGETGRIGSALYACNTAGGALGVLLAAFWLPPWLGYDLSYLGAIVVNLLLAVGAAALATHAPAAARGVQRPAVVRHPAAAPATQVLPARATAGLAALSGFAALGLEVLWTRMFAQVLHNSVYSFGAILVTFLAALAGGAALARVLMVRSGDRVVCLAWILAASAIAVGLSPFAFYFATDGLRYVAATEGWLGYLGVVFGLAALVVGVPTLLLGAVFPLLLGLRPDERGAGRIVGRLAAINTLGAIAGSAAAGFVLLPWLGLWASVRTMAVLYAVAAWVVANRFVPAAVPAPEALRAVRAAPLVLLVALVTIADAARLPRLPDLQNLKRPPAIHQVWEGADGTVAVVSVGGHLRTIVDNYYSLGSSEEKQYEETQADLPLLLHPRPRSVFFLGLGTGITAGAALRHPIERLVAAELSPAVAEASRRYFGPFNNDLFSDPRAEIVVDDGRQYLLATGERFDVIVSDLFIPWQSGAGSLYTREAFAAARDRLAPGGLFAQWLPLYQLSRDELETITRTFLEVFPQVTLWRGDFLPSRPIVALVGEREPRPLDASALVDSYRNLRGSPALGREAVLGLLGMFYAGNLGEARALFADWPINSDDHPIIEYRSPVTHREQRAGRASWLVGRDLIDWYAALHRAAPLSGDPYLAQLEAREIGFVEAGLLLLRAQASAAEGDAVRAAGAFEEFRQRVPDEIAARFTQLADRSAAEPSAGSQGG